MMKQATISGLRGMAWLLLLGEALLIGLLAGVTVTYAVGPMAGIAAGVGVLAVWCLAVRRRSFTKLLKAKPQGGQA